MADNYELVPLKDFLELKNELEDLKKNPLAHTPADLLSGITLLNNSINRLIEIFKEASKKLEPESSHNDTRILDRLGNLESQNKDIAKALVSFGENVGSFKNDLSRLKDTIGTLAFKVENMSMKETSFDKPKMNFYQAPKPTNPQYNFSAAPAQPQVPKKDDPFVAPQNPMQNSSFGQNPFPRQNPQFQQKEPFGAPPPKMPSPPKDDLVPNIPPSMPPPPPKK